MSIYRGNRSRKFRQSTFMFTNATQTCRVHPSHCQWLSRSLQCSIVRRTIAAMRALVSHHSLSCTQNCIRRNSLSQSVCSQTCQSIMTLDIIPLTVPTLPFPPNLWLTAWTRCLAPILASTILISRIWTRAV